MGVSNFVKILKTVNNSSKFICWDLEAKKYDLIVIDLMCYIYSAVFRGLNPDCKQKPHQIFVVIMMSLMSRLLPYGNKFEFVVDNSDRCVSKKKRTELNEEVKVAVKQLLEDYKIYMLKAITIEVKHFFFSTASSEAECHAWWKYKGDLSRNFLQVSRDSDIFIIDSIHNLDHITALYDDSKDGLLRLQKPLSFKQRNFINVLLVALGNDYLDTTYSPSKYERFCGNILCQLEGCAQDEVLEFKKLWCILAKSTIMTRSGNIKYSTEELQKIYKIRNSNWNWYKNYILTSKQGDAITRCDYKRCKDSEEFYSNPEQY